MKNETLKVLQANLRDYDLLDRIEILANLFVQEGLENMGGSLPAHISHENLKQILFLYESEHGDTLASALVKQGIVLHSWVNTIRTSN